MAVVIFSAEYVELAKQAVASQRTEYAVSTGEELRKINRIMEGWRQKLGYDLDEAWKLNVRLRYEHPIISKLENVASFRLTVGELGTGKVEEVIRQLAMDGYGLLAELLIREGTLPFVEDFITDIV